MSEEKKETKVDMMVQYEKISPMTGLEAEMIAVLHNTVAKNTTISELAYFLTVCKSIGLNPINKEVWCYKDGKGNLIVFTGRDGFLKKAQESPKYYGLRSCEVRENDIFRIDIPNAKIIHEFSTEDRGNIIGAYAIAFVKDKESTIEWVSFKDYDKGQSTWKQFGADMIKKVAECHALKKAFGIANLTSEYDVENIKYYEKHPMKPQIPEDKSEERLLLMISDTKDKKSLEELFQYCGTPETKSAYDKQFKELKK